MAAHPDNLIWIDLEMTGLDTNSDSIIEIATIVTDSHLNILEEGPVFAIFQPESKLSAMDDWNTNQHNGSGLVKRVRSSPLNEQDAESMTIDFLKKYVPAKASPMCGNSICQDRRFLARCMPDLEAYFHYRNLDVSSIKELAKRWAPNMDADFKKNATHLALDDVRDSIRELQFYREKFFKLPSAT